MFWNSQINFFFSNQISITAIFFFIFGITAFERKRKIIENLGKQFVILNLSMQYENFKPNFKYYWKKISILLH